MQFVNVNTDQLDDICDRISAAAAQSNPTQSNFNNRSNSNFRTPSQTGPEAESYHAMRSFFDIEDDDEHNALQSSTNRFADPSAPHSYINENTTLLSSELGRHTSYTGGNAVNDAKNSLSTRAYLQREQSLAMLNNITGYTTNAIMSKKLQQLELLYSAIFLAEVDRVNAFYIELQNKLYVEIIYLFAQCTQYLKQRHYNEFGNDKFFNVQNGSPDCDWKTDSSKSNHANHFSHTNYHAQIASSNNITMFYTLFYEYYYVLKTIGIHANDLDKAFAVQLQYGIEQTASTPTTPGVMIDTQQQLNPVNEKIEKKDLTTADMTLGVNNNRQKPSESISIDKDTFDILDNFLVTFLDETLANDPNIFSQHPNFSENRRGDDSDGDESSWSNNNKNSISTPTNSNSSHMSSDGSENFHILLSNSTPQKPKKEKKKRKQYLNKHKNKYKLDIPSMELSIRDIFRCLYLLLSYCNLNKNALYISLERHDTCSPIYLYPHLSPTVNKTLFQHYTTYSKTSLSVLISLYSLFFNIGDKKKVWKILKSQSVIEPHTEPKTSTILMLNAISLIFIIAVLFITIKHPAIHVWVLKLFPLWRFSAFFIFFIYSMGALIYYCIKTNINYIFLLNLNPLSVYTHKSLFYHGSLLLIITAGNILLLSIFQLYHIQSLTFLPHLLIISSYMYYLYLNRVYLWQCAYNVITCQSTFLSSFAGDQLCSLTRLCGDVLYLVIFYTHVILNLHNFNDLPIINDIIQRRQLHANATISSTVAQTVNQSYSSINDYTLLSEVKGIVKQYMWFISILPFVLRAVQCLRSYYFQNNYNPRHIGNSVKYLVAIITATFAVLYKQALSFRPSISPPSPPPPQELIQDPKTAKKQRVDSVKLAKKNTHPASIIPYPKLEHTKDDTQLSLEPPDEDHVSYEYESDDNDVEDVPFSSGETYHVRKNGQVSVNGNKHDQKIIEKMLSKNNTSFYLPTLKSIFRYNGPAVDGIKASSGVDNQFNNRNAKTNIKHSPHTRKGPFMMQSLDDGDFIDSIQIINDDAQNDHQNSDSGNTDSDITEQSDFTSYLNGTTTFQQSPPNSNFTDIIVNATAVVTTAMAGVAPALPHSSSFSSTLNADVYNMWLTQLQYIFVFFAVVTTLYQLVWDFRVDWGLFEEGKYYPFRKKSIFRRALKRKTPTTEAMITTSTDSNPKIGETDKDQNGNRATLLALKPPKKTLIHNPNVISEDDRKNERAVNKRITYIYSLAMIANTVMRLFWIETLIPFSTSNLFGGDLSILILGLIEIVRRAIWSYFRLEAQQLLNNSEFKPINFKVPDLKTTQMTKNDVSLGGDAMGNVSGSGLRGSSRTFVTNDNTPLSVSMVTLGNLGPVQPTITPSNDNIPPNTDNVIIPIMALINNTANNTGTMSYSNTTPHRFSVANLYNRQTSSGIALNTTNNEADILKSSTPTPSNTSSDFTIALSGISGPSSRASGLKARLNSFNDQQSDGSPMVNGSGPRKMSSVNVFETGSFASNNSNHRKKQSAQRNSIAEQLGMLPVFDTSTSSTDTTSQTNEKHTSNTEELSNNLQKLL